MNLKKMADTIEKISIYHRIFPFIIIGLVVFIQSVFGFYSIYDIAPPGSFVLLSYICLFWLIGDWFSRDSKKNRIDWVFDMGFFLYISWPIFIPFYLFKTRGLKYSLTVTFGFVVLYFGTYFLSYYLLYEIAP
jgi:hypothetical protein